MVSEQERDFIEGIVLDFLSNSSNLIHLSRLKKQSLSSIDASDLIEDSKSLEENLIVPDNMK